VKGNQIRGRGLCFQPGAKNPSSSSGARLLMISFTLSFEMGVGTGAGVEGGTHARRGGGERSAATTTDGKAQNGAAI
jgi:hypothetical protein